MLSQLLLGLEGWLEHSSIPHVHFSFNREKRFCSFVWSSALLLGLPSYLFQISLTTKFISPILTFIFRYIFSNLILIFIHYFEASLAAYASEFSFTFRCKYLLKVPEVHSDGDFWLTVSQQCSPTLFKTAFVVTNPISFEVYIPTSSSITVHFCYRHITNCWLLQ